MIEATGLSKVFGRRMAIENINFKVNSGEIVGLLGPNGSGKSTTIKILTGVIPASSGTATLAGFDLFQETMEVKKNVGYLPENPPVYFDMIVEDYLKFAAKLHFVPRSKLNASLDHALEKTGLREVRKRLIGNLSKGYRQRVGLAQALVHDPKIIILDEPTVGLDPVQIIEFRELIKSLRGSHTVILSSHILPEITATCDRVIVMNRGVMVAQNTLEPEVTYKMIVKDANESGLKSLRRVPGVHSIEVLPSPPDQKLIIKMTPSQNDFRTELLHIALKEKMGVLEFTHENQGLEALYLQLTSQESSL